MTADEQIAAAYDFSSFQTIIALGVESARLFTIILRTNPHLMGVLFDRAAALDRARAILADTGVQQYCDVIVGDYFEDVPLWGNLYLLAHLVGHYSDEQALTVLRHCRHCMHPAGRVLLLEELTPADTMAPISQPDRSHSEQQYRLLLQAAGLHLARVLSTGTPASLLEATSQQQPAR